jgi:hypothetical protein
MLQLPLALAAWNSPAFAAVLKDELAGQAAALPLQQATAYSSAALDDGIEIMLIGTEETAAVLHIRVGVFFSGIVAGCSCADDPTPVEAQPEYCELELRIDPATAVTAVRLVG